MINADYFRVAQRFTRSNYPGRPELAGVLIDPCPLGGVIMFATTGETAAAIWDPLGCTPVPLCLRVDTGGNWGGFTKDAILAFEGPSATLRSGRGEDIAALPYEHFDPLKYPKWQRLFPDGTQIIRDIETAFDLQLWKLFALNGKVDPIGIWAYEKGGMVPHLVTHEEYPTFLGLIMPIRVDGEHMFRRPKWLD